MRILVVGGGSIGERHLRCFSEVIGKPCGLCEPKPDRRESLRDQYHLPTEVVFEDLQAALAVNWDAAICCTPAHLHVPQALALLPQTKALLIEKPLSVTFEGLSQLQTAAAGTFVRVAYVYRAHPAVAEIRQALRAGELGELLQITATGGQHFPTFRPDYRQLYYADRDRGGGAIQDALTHWIDLTVYLSGAFEWVCCDGAHQCLPDVAVEDTVHLLGRTDAGKVMVSLSLNQFMAPNESTLQLNGSRGSAKLLLHENRWGICRHGGSWHWYEPKLSDRDALFRLQAQGFLRGARGEPDDLCRLEEAVHVLQVQRAALSSSERGILRIGREDFPCAG